MKRMPRLTEAPKPILDAAHYAWLALGVFLLTVYGSLIPLHYRALPLNEAWTTFLSRTLKLKSMLGFVSWEKPERLLRNHLPFREDTRRSPELWSWD